MKPFEIIIKESNCLVLSTSYINPLSNLDMVEEELKNKKYNGKVFFDLLLSNGKNKNRFIKAIYSSGFNKNDFLEVETIPLKLLELSKSFYENNLNLIENSILTKSQKFLLSKGKLL